MKTIDKILDLDNTPWRIFEPSTKKNNKSWCVLWLQGFTSTIEGHAEGVARLSMATSTPFAMLNYAGHGNHPTPLEQATRKQQFDEVIAVYDELMKLGYKNIIVIGASFGGYMAALLVGMRRPRALVLRVAANYHEEELNLPYRDTAEGRDNRKHSLNRVNSDEHFVNNAVRAVGHFGGDTFVIEHERDKVIKPAVLKSYYNAAKHGNYIVIRGLEHSPKLMSNPEPYVKTIELWLATIINSVKQNNP